MLLDQTAPPPPEDRGSRPAGGGSLSACPATPRCRRLVGRGQHVLVGVSPFNTRFSPPYLGRLMTWARAEFDRFNILVPGQREVAWMLEAAGTAPGKAARKARKELNRVVRLVHVALEDAGAGGRGDLIVPISDFDGVPAYRAMVAAAEATYGGYPAFRAACQEMSQIAVRSRQRALGSDRGPLGPEQLDLATRYVLAEVPFFLDTPTLLDVPSSLLAYHRPWPIGGLLFSGDLPLRVGRRQGYVVVSIPIGGGPGQQQGAA